MSQVCRASPFKKYVIYDSKEPIPAMEQTPVEVPAPAVEPDPGVVPAPSRNRLRLFCPKGDSDSGIGNKWNHNSSSSKWLRKFPDPHFSCGHL